MDNATFYNNLSRPCPVPVGSRIELVSMPNDPDALAPGTLGTVTGGNGAQMYVDWDNGRTLILLPGVDRWVVIQDD
jgi:hypothetical protein